MLITLLILVILAVVLVIAPMGADFYTNWLWFQSIGQQNVFATVVSSQIVLFALGAGVFLVLTMISLFAARVVARKLGELPLPREGVLTYIARMEAHALDRLVTFGAFGLAVVCAIVMGLVASAQWELAQQFLHQAPFGKKEPLFNLDAGFYVFSLPFYEFLQGWAIAAIILVALLTAGYYVLRSYGFNVRSSDIAALTTVRGVRIHFSVLAALLALLIALGYQFDSYDLVYSTRGVVHGAGYADVNAELPALTFLGAVAVAMAIALIVNAFRRGFALAGLSIAGWVLAAIVVGGIYPSLFEQVSVRPNEIERETPYLQRNIDMTRYAFNLDKIATQDFAGDTPLPPNVVDRNPQTFGSIRLWDDRPLLDTYNQIQTIRLYYDFNSISIDRYQIDGQYRQVMLSARELSPDRLPAQAQTWVTRHLQFTHGYGLAMSPVNQATEEGLPTFFVSDIPPTGDIPVKQPQIYYGLTSQDFVVVNTNVPEFDYPKGNDNVYSKYAGGHGVQLSSLIRKIAFAIRFQDGNLLLTSAITPQSEILFNRSVAERVHEIASFLLLDSDPYLVDADGNLYWIQDAYTATDEFPYSTPYRGSLNYVRNSVKVVVNAYDGMPTFYVADQTDPIIQTYEQIFPGLFQPLATMPAALRAHIRYPEGMFLIQADMYRTYHMQDPQVFYNREDLWSMPQEVTQGAAQDLQPYYVIMRLPGSNKEEFLLMLPFTPSNKTNMVAWLAAESDGADYGKMLVYLYPKDKVIFGPAQVEARIDQNATISAQLSLWNQQGSQVIRGNLLVLPVENSTLYVEPIYLQASNSKLPELKRVIVATENNLVMEPSLQEALAAIFGGTTTASAPSVVPAVAATATPAPSGTPSATPAAGPTAAAATTGTPAQLAQSAQAHLQAAQAAAQRGDWAQYGQELKALQSDLDQLVKATNP